MTNHETKDPLGDAIRQYFSFKDQAAEKMVTYQQEQKVFMRNLLNSGVTAAEANMATVDFKKVSIHYAAVAEALQMAEDAMKSARALYDAELHAGTVDTVVQSSFKDIDWSEIVEKSPSNGLPK